MLRRARSRLSAPRRDHDRTRAVHVVPRGRLGRHQAVINKRLNRVPQVGLRCQRAAASVEEIADRLHEYLDDDVTYAPYVTLPGTPFWRGAGRRAKSACLGWSVRYAVHSVGLQGRDDQPEQEEARQRENHGESHESTLG